MSRELKVITIFLSQVDIKKRLFLYALDSILLPCYHILMNAGYVRVSTLDQVEYGKGLEIQKEAILEYGNKNGINIDKFYVVTLYFGFKIIFWMCFADKY